MGSRLAESGLVLCTPHQQFRKTETGVEEFTYGHRSLGPVVILPARTQKRKTSDPHPSGAGRSWTRLGIRVDGRGVQSAWRLMSSSLPERVLG